MKFELFSCPTCKNEKGLKIRSSRKVTSHFIEHYLICDVCKEKFKAVNSIKCIWPSNQWDEQRIRKEFSSYHVVECIEEIHEAYINHIQAAKSNINRLKEKLNAAKLNAEKIESNYELLLKIGNEYRSSDDKKSRLSVSSFWS